MCAQRQWWGVIAEPCNWQTSGTTEADDRVRSGGTRASCHPWLLPTEEVSINLGGRQATFKLFINLTLMKHEEEAVVLSFRLHGLPIQPMAAQGLSQNWEPSGTFHVETTMLQFA